MGKNKQKVWIQRYKKAKRTGKLAVVTACCIFAGFALSGWTISMAENSEETPIYMEGTAGALTEQQTALESVWGAETEAGSEQESVSEECLPGQMSEGHTEDGTERETDGESEEEFSGETEMETAAESETEDSSGAQDGVGTEAVDEAVTETEDMSETITEPESEGVIETEHDRVSETDGRQPATEKPKTQDAKDIHRGTHYELVGDSNCWYRNPDGKLWVRKGSGLYIETKAGGMYNRGKEKQNLLEDGVLKFSLMKADSEGRIIAQSKMAQEPYYVDGEAPQASVLLNGNREKEMVYASQSASAELLIEPDGKSGLKTAKYCILPCGENGAVQEASGEWIPCVNGQKVDLKKEGNFQVFVQTEDLVGNADFFQSSIVCVDRTAPEITIKGASDRTANAGSVVLAVSCEDVHYRPGTMKIEVIGANTGKMPRQRCRLESGKGAEIQFLDFPKERQYDDIYTVRVSAEDLAGNRTERTMEFSVNRFGSVYDLSGETKKNLKRHYLPKPSDVVFYETNIDYVGESEILCRKDGELITLKRGRDYTVRMEGGDDSWKRYQYTVPAAFFQEEGVYELLLSTSDAAENSSDTGIQEKRVVFALDCTPPGCTVTGIEPDGIYETKRMTACFVPYDNIGVQEVKVYCDNSLIYTASGDDPIKIPLEASDRWQTLQVFASDQAGNEYRGEKIPVYVGALPGGNEKRDTEVRKKTKLENGFSGARRQQGVWLLAVGGTMLAGTLFVCMRSGIRRKN